MFCPNCGTQLVKLNQRFCHTCGIDLSMIFNRPQLRPERTQNAAIAKSKSTPVYNKTPQLRPERAQDAAIAKAQLKPVYTSFPVSQQMLITKREVGTYSKMCFSFALVSFIAAIFSVFSGIAILTILLLFTLMSRDIFGVRIIGFIVSLSINSVGLIFGILSRGYNKKAKKSNSSNSIKKVGHVFGIIGVIFNTLELAIALTIMGFVIAFATL